MATPGWYDAMVKEMPDLLDSEKQILRALLVDEETTADTNAPEVTEGVG